VATLGFFTTAWGRRSAIVLGLSAFSVALVLGLLVNAVFDVSWLPASEVFFSDEHGPFELVLAAVLALIMLAGVWRKGPLGWSAVVFDLIPIGHRIGRAHSADHDGHDRDDGEPDPCETGEEDPVCCKSCNCD
jgi:hypothetical protein